MSSAADTDLLIVQSTLPLSTLASLVADKQNIKAIKAVELRIEQTSNFSSSCSTAFATLKFVSASLLTPAAF